MKSVRLMCQNDYVESILIIGGIYVFFLVNGVAQERLYTVGKEEGDQFIYGKFIIFCVAFFNIFAAIATMFMDVIMGYRIQASDKSFQDFIGHVFQRIYNSRMRTLMQSGTLLSVCATVAATGCTSMLATATALNYVNYPTQVLMKSAKTVPVVLGNLIIYQVVYPWYDNVTVVIVTFSLICFNLVKQSNQTTESNSWFGIFLLCVALIMDGITGPRQDKLVKKYHLTSSQLMFMQNIFGSLICFFLWLGTDGIMPPISFLQRHPDAIGSLILYIISGVFGQVLIYRALVRFGSLYLALITTVRKFMTVVISVVVFGHRLSIYQWTSVCGVFTALLFQSYCKNASQGKSKVQ